MAEEIQQSNEAVTRQEGEETVVVPEKFQALVEQIEKLSVLELSELVKILEEKFGVSSATAPIMAMGMMSGGLAASQGEAQEEKTSFNIELTSAGGNKIAVIKTVREITQIGLKDAKDLVDSAPKMVKEGAKKEEAEEIKKKLEAAGAKVTLK